MTDTWMKCAMSDRCEPPEHLRNRDGWHWVQRDAPAAACVAVLWSARYAWWGFRGGTQYADMAAREGWRYLAPVTPPATVAALVEALDFYACVDHYPVHHAVAPEVVRNDGGGKARAALALYRGEVA